MSYQYITRYTSPNSGYKGRKKGGNAPRYIVIHHWGKDGQSFWGVVTWLCNPRAQASAHYVVEDGKVACILDQSDCAWHTGNEWYNKHSIGIECRPEMSQGDLDTVAELVARIWKEQGKELPLIGHKDIVATACPGRYYKKLKEIRDKARKISNPDFTPVRPDSPDPNPKGELYRVRKSWKNVASQLGAFTDKEKAIDLASSRRDYKVYDKDGDLVWAPKSFNKDDIFDTHRTLTPHEAMMAGQAWSNRILQTKICVDGRIGPASRANKVKMLQWALNRDYNAHLRVDGKLGSATKKALGNHFVKRGETQYLVTAVEVLLLFNGYNPRGVEKPGVFGKDCEDAVESFQRDMGLAIDGCAGRNTILELVA